MEIFLDIRRSVPGLIAFWATHVDPFAMQVIQLWPDRHVLAVIL